MAFRLAAVTLVSGCAGLLGIEPAVLDGETHIVARAVREVVVNGPDGLPGLFTESAQLEHVSVRVLRDGAWVDAAVDVRPDQVAFDVPAPGTPYRVVAFLDGQPMEFQHVAPALTVASRSLGRRDPTPVTLSTQILFAGLAAPSFTVIASTGQWTFTQATDTRLDWRNVSPIASPQIGLLSRAAGDQLFELGFSQASTMASFSIDITQALAVPVEMQDGELLSLPNPTAIARDRCATVVADQRVDEARIRSAYPDATFREDAVTVGAAADPRFALVALPLSLAASTQPATDAFDEKRTYANPFPGHKAVVSSATAFDRNTEPIAIERAQLIDDETCTAPQHLDGPIALPTAFALGDTPLVVDNSAVSLGVGDPVVSWRPDGPGAADAYTVQLVELAPGGPRPVRTIMTTATEAPIDPALLLVDHQYLVRVTAIVGSPDAAAGDLSSFTLPHAEARASSFAFRIAR